jgi:predicted transcriptional regulator
MPRGQELQYLRKLLQVLDKRFDEGELRTLCFHLSVDYDSLPGEGKANKARELVAYLERRGRISEFAGIVGQLRPDISWEETPQASKEALPTFQSTSPERLFEEAAVQVTVLLEGDVQELTSGERESFILALSRILNINPDLIRILRIAPGSILVTLEMPTEAAQLLVSMYLARDPALQTIRIAKVELMDAAGFKDVGEASLEQPMGKTQVTKLDVLRAVFQVYKDEPGEKVNSERIRKNLGLSREQMNDIILALRERGFIKARFLGDRALLEITADGVTVLES